MSKVINLDSRRPHLTIPGLKSNHVIPIVVIQAVIEGRLPIWYIEDCDDFVPTILKEWLKDLQEK